MEMDNDRLSEKETRRNVVKSASIFFLDMLLGAVVYATYGTHIYFLKNHQLNY